MGAVNHCSLHCRLTNFVVWGEGGNTALWLVRNRDFFYVPSINYQAVFLFSQSQRCISPFSSNQGISPNDSVNYSGWPLP